MTAWTREFIEGRIVYVIRPDPGDAIGAANTVYQLLPTLMTGEEIRIRAGGDTSPNLGSGGTGLSGTGGPGPMIRKPFYHQEHDHFFLRPG